MRPFRVPRRITLTVGQDEGDLQGKDDKIIQAAVDYVARLGGGTVKILPGTYAMNNAVFLRAGITLQGAGETTILQKGPCHSTPLVRDSDWYEWGIVVKNTKGFTPGCGIAVSNNKPDWPPVCLFTVTAVRGNVLFLDQKLDKNFWVADAAQAQTLHSLICGYDTDDVVIENIVLDGARDQNDYLNDNFGGAAFMQDCNRWTFRNVVARNFNGDGFSFQVCDDIHFDACRSTDNAGRGFHPGSGSCRPVFKRCHRHGQFPRPVLVLGRVRRTGGRLHVLGKYILWIEFRTPGHEQRAATMYVRAQRPVGRGFPRRREHKARRKQQPHRGMPDPRQRRQRRLRS